MTKTCTKCLEDKPEDAFAWRNKAKGLRAYWCKSCLNSHEKERFQDPTSNYRKRTRSNQLVYRERNREFIWNYLQDKCCAECGERDPVVLEFNHLDPSEKCHNVSELIARGNGLETIQEEISKCEVLCANCHRRKTSAMFGWFKQNLLEFDTAVPK